MEKRIPLLNLLKHERGSRLHTGKDMFMIEIDAMANPLTLHELFVSFYSTLSLSLSSFISLSLSHTHIL